MSQMLNPLVIPNIVSNILNHININDLKFMQSLRLISQCWNEEVCSQLRRHKMVTIKAVEKLEEYNDTFGASVTFPHSQYLLSLLYDFKEPETIECMPKSLQLFFASFAPCITTLHLTIRRGNFEFNVLNDIFSKTPNLTKLGLTVHYYCNVNEFTKEFSDDAKQNLRRVHTLIVQIEGIEISEYTTCALLLLLFKSMSNLQRIIYPGDIRRISKVGLLLMESVLDSENYLLPKLAEWEFKTRILEEEALKLLCKDFPMKTLYADLWNPDDEYGCVSSDIMSGLMRKWNETLEKLAIDFPWRKEISFHFNFPLTMRNLSFVYLGGFEGCLLDLLRKLPSLRRLELSQLDLNSILPKPEEQDKYATVKKLRLDFCTGQSGAVLSRFSRIFPALGSLNINHTTNDVARVIFQKMSQLTRLRMQGSELTDAGMCGFSEHTLKENNFLALTPTQGSSYRKYSFIADLKYLQYLKLDAYEVSEVTVRHGLVHCTSLRLVKIDSTGSSSGCDPSATLYRTFKLADYGKHLVEENKTRTVVEMKEEPPLEQEALDFFQSHRKYKDDLANL